jgi:hypothetical protein
MDGCTAEMQGARLPGPAASELLKTCMSAAYCLSPTSYNPDLVKSGHGTAVLDTVVAAQQERSRHLLHTLQTYYHTASGMALRGKSCRYTMA